MNFKNNTYILNFDGSCSKNPGGIGAYGFILTQDGEVVKDGFGIVPTKNVAMTNNIAEYYAIIMAFEAFINYSKYKKGVNNILIVKGDSDLVVKQLNKTWKTHNDKPYFPYFYKANELLKTIRKNNWTVNIHWIPRKQNQACDDLSKAYKKVTK